MPKMTIRGWLTAVGIGVALLLTGLGGGLYLGQRVTHVRSALDVLSASAAIRMRAEVLYSDGDYDAATDALTDYLKFIDARVRRPDIELFWLDARGAAFERMLTYARLALLQERRTAPDPQRAEDYWRQAEQAAVTAGLKDSSRAAVRAIVERADQDVRPKSP